MALGLIEEPSGGIELIGLGHVRRDVDTVPKVVTSRRPNAKLPTVVAITNVAWIAWL
jgi:hypothetical protein